MTARSATTASSPTPPPSPATSLSRTTQPSALSARFTSSARIGRYAYIGGGTTITQDVLPFSLTSAKRETHAYGLNKIGLERRGFTPEQLNALQHAYRLLLAAETEHPQALETPQDPKATTTEDVAYLVKFIERCRTRSAEVAAMKLGLIAGNGRFPFLLLDAARAHGEESSSPPSRKKPIPRSKPAPPPTPASRVHWLSLGELSRLIETFQAERRHPRRDGRAGEAQADLLQHPARLAARQAAAQPAHAQYRHAAGRGRQGSRRRRHRADLLHLVPGTAAGQTGVLTTRAPNERRARDIDYGRSWRLRDRRLRHRPDRGDRRQACVAVEAMEGTDAAIERAGA